MKTRRYKSDDGFTFRAIGETGLIMGAHSFCNLVNEKLENLEQQNQILGEKITEALLQYELKYGMPESEASKFRTRRIKVILQEAIEKTEGESDE